MPVHEEVTRIAVFEPGQGWRESASIFLLPGEMVVVAVAVFYAFVGGIVLVSASGDRTREFQQ